MKRITAILLAMIMLFSNTAEVWAGELETQNSSEVQGQITYATGLQEVKAVGIPEDEMTEKVYDYEEILESVEISVQSAVYNHDWDKYSTNYFYNQLSAEYKAIWDAMDALCLKYMNNTEYISGGSLEAISAPKGMTKNDVRMLWSLFTYSNPQYYFLLNEYSYAYISSTGAVSAIILRCYDDFCDGQARANATAKVKAQIQAWEAAVAGYNTDEEKVKAIFDLICNNVDYDHDAANGRVLEQESFSQSIYSTFCMGKTVCAGYADALTLLCNGAGIDAVSVTSPGHQWNKIRINDSWYNYDATWGDQANKIYYGYYGRSDYIFDTEGNTSSHQEVEFWNQYLPKCTLDVTPSDPWKAPGVYPQIANTTAAPSITVTKQNDQYLVTITSSTPNAEIYYTVDGSVPSAAYGKATKYTAPFAVEGGNTVKAIAVCDTRYDSSVTTQSLDNEQDSDTSKNGWVQENGNWYYYVNGTAQTGWVNAGGTWYYMNGSGVMQTGWVNAGGTWYYMNGSGVMQTGWVNAGGTWYYMNGSGVMQTGWVNVAGTWYYMNAGGAMTTGWLNDGGTWYYMSGSGAMQTGWVNVGGTWYYMNAGGAMTTGWLNDGGTWYYMNAGGAMTTGWLNDGGAWYYMNAGGAMTTGWVNVGGTWYYMNGSGVMQTGWVNDGGTWYYLDASGAWIA